MGCGASNADNDKECLMKEEAATHHETRAVPRPPHSVRQARAVPKQPCDNAPEELTALHDLQVYQRKPETNTDYSSGSCQESQMANTSATSLKDASSTSASTWKASFEERRKENHTSIFDDSDDDEPAVAKAEKMGEPFDPGNGAHAVCANVIDFTCGVGIMGHNFMSGALADNMESFQSQMTNEVKKGGLQAANVELQELVSIKAPEMGMLWVMNSLHPMAANANLEVVEMKAAVVDREGSAACLVTMNTFVEGAYTTGFTLDCVDCIEMDDVKPEWWGNATARYKARQRLIKQVIEYIGVDHAEVSPHERRVALGRHLNLEASGPDYMWLKCQYEQFM